MRFLLITFLTVLSKFVYSQIPIQPTIMGHNFWNFNASNLPNGSITTAVTTNDWTNIELSGVKLMRVGGWNYNNTTGGDFFGPSNALGYVKIVDEIRKHKAEPLITVPFKSPLSPNLTQLNISQQARNAAEIVRVLNVTNKRNVKYFIISNEPEIDHFDKYPTFEGTQTAANRQYIANYIKAFSIEMKKVDPEIKIIGPEFAYPHASWFDGDENGAENGLFKGDGNPSDISGTIPEGNGLASNKPYVDFLSFHSYTYSFPISNFTRDKHNRDIELDWGFKGYCRDAKSRIDYLNSLVGWRPQGYPLGFMITEANVNTNNESAAAPNLSGFDSRSFAGGQHWARMISIAMEFGASTIAFWSIKEPDYNGDLSDRGYLSYSTGDGTRRPSYFHYKLIADHFKGMFYEDEKSYDEIWDNNATPPDFVQNPTKNPKHLKAFASKYGNKIAVMILNSKERVNSTDEQTYKINFTNNLSTSGANANFVFNNLSASLADITGSLSNESTKVLIINCSTGIVDGEIVYRKGIDSEPIYLTGSNTLQISTSSTNSCRNEVGSGSGSASVSITPVGTGYTYTWNTNPVQNTATASNLVPGIYECTINNSGSCFESMKVTVAVNEVSALVDAGQDLRVCQASSKQLGNSFSLTNYSYSWNPASGLSSTNSSNPTFTPGSSTTFTVTSTMSGSTCYGYDQVVATVSSSNKVTDAVILNSIVDDGNEPDIFTVPQNMDLSPDIWVRNSMEALISSAGSPPRYTNEHDHINPDVLEGTANVFVKVKNFGCETYDGKVRIWVRHSCINCNSNDFPTNSSPAGGQWNEITTGGGKPINLPAGSEGVIYQPWPVGTGVVDDEYCILAAVEAVSPVVDFPKVSDYSPNVYQDIESYNNMAQKNVVMVEGPPIAKPLIVGNIYGTPATATFTFSSDNNPPITRVGSIFVDLGPVLYEKWVAGGKQGYGVEEVPYLPLENLDNTPNPNEPNTALRITTANSWISGLSFLPNEEHKLNVMFQFNNPESVSPHQQFGVNIYQTISGDVIGNTKYFVKRGVCPPSIISLSKIGLTPVLSVSVPENYSVEGYQWSFNGSPIPGAINDSLIPTMPGRYSLTVNYYEGCSASTNVIEFSNSLFRLSGIQNSQATFLKIAPNPATNEFVVSYSSDPAELMELIVTDATGKIVLKEQLNQSSGHYRFNAANLSNGFYLVKILNQGVERKSSKLVIAK